MILQHLLPELQLVLPLLLSMSLLQLWLLLYLYNWADTASADTTDIVSAIVDNDAGVVIVHVAAAVSCY